MSVTSQIMDAVLMFCDQGNHTLHYRFRGGHHKIIIERGEHGTRSSPWVEVSQISLQDVLTKIAERLIPGWMHPHATIIDPIVTTP